MLADLYRSPQALLTDLYQLTMAAAHRKLGTTSKQAAFHVSFRSNPFDGGFAVACGLHPAIEFLQNLRFTDDDCGYLATLEGSDDQPLFDRGFLDYLRGLRLTLDVDAVPEGTVVFPHEPLLRVQGPILEAQIVETALLNFLNFQTLIATKAARICMAARGEPVIEFGLRRAQGPDGGVSAARAAYVGGCAGSSNVLAGKFFGIPIKGTHAHSWIMSFDSEPEAFAAYAQAMPNNCVFLVDTYDSLEGVRNAVRVGKQLRENGHRLLGIRLDSGDLAYLSIKARKILDEAGFTGAVIMASNELDEHVITSLKLQGAAINVWGVGTRLTTAYDQPALGGVYKLAAVRDGPDEKWEHRIKLSEQTAKLTTPGILQVRRFSNGTEFIGDAIYDDLLGIGESPTTVDPLDMTRRKHFASGTSHDDLLVPIFRGGGRVYEVRDIEATRQRTQAQLASLHPGIKRFVNPHQYPVGLEQALHELKTKLILEARAKGGRPQ